MFRLFALVLALVSLAACTNPDDLDKAPVDLGDFKLGYNVVVAPNLTKGPASRDASKEEWIAEMQKAIDERFGRYDGDKLYHMGISLEGYVLAIPGVPIVASPKSALILNVTLWDDAAGKKMNEKPEQVTIIESISGHTVLGSGLTQTAEVQMTNLSRNAAKLIQNWLVRQKYQEDWFSDTPGTAARPVAKAAAKPTAPTGQADAESAAKPRQSDAAAKAAVAAEISADAAAVPPKSGKGG